MNTQILDSLQSIKFSIEELKALQAVIVMSEDHPVYSNAHETLIVARTSLTSIIADLEESVDTIDEDMRNAQ